MEARSSKGRHMLEVQLVRILVMVSVAVLAVVWAMALVAVVAAAEMLRYSLLVVETLVVKCRVSMPQWRDHTMPEHPRQESQDQSTSDSWHFSCLLFRNHNCMDR